MVADLFVTYGHLTSHMTIDKTLDMVKTGKPAQTHTVGVADFKARCLKLLDDVGTRGDEIVVTKRGKPIAKIEPIRPVVDDLKGMYAGRARILGDIVNFNLADDWELADDSKANH